MSSLFNVHTLKLFVKTRNSDMVINSMYDTTLPLTAGKQARTMSNISTNWLAMARFKRKKSSAITIVTGNRYKNNGDSKPKHDSKSLILWTRKTQQEVASTLRNSPSIY